MRAGSSRALARDQLTADDVRAGLDYDPETGIFRWRNPATKVVAGSIAGTLQRTYWMIHFRGVDYHAHRLAWLYVRGAWPTGEVDHRNGNRLDNRIANLRDATRSQNCANMGLASHNTSGFNGVSFYRQTGRWQAYIRHGGRRLHLGMFATAEDAAAAYDAAAIRLKGEFARTNAMIQAEAA